MVDEASFDPDPILSALNAHGVSYVVVGGLAVAAHGVIRATADLDLVVAADWDNAEALARALTEVDARDLDEQPQAISREALVRRVDRRLHTRHGDVHLLHEVDGIPRYDDLQPPAVFDVGGIAVPVARREDLVAMKRSAGRPKDLIDVAELEALEPGDSA